MRLFLDLSSLLHEWWCNAMDEPTFCLWDQPNLFIFPIVLTSIADIYNFVLMPVFIILVPFCILLLLWGISSLLLVGIHEPPKTCRLVGRIPYVCLRFMFKSVLWGKFTNMHEHVDFVFNVTIKSIRNNYLCIK